MKNFQKAGIKTIARRVAGTLPETVKTTNTETGMEAAACATPYTL
ncbi:hypothetical protein QN362_17275 [Actimicrobium sp. CCC2.4]|nr:hypothetical protein [Actimicrobium sp. CCC2.4]MEB0137090.1 hypothetical protein [Actimicrobium sp. CCC2.4]WPX33674.1 hypothetical protein RHM62_07565 [Actimicrobium sp. CCC2.4]